MTEDRRRMTKDRQQRTAPPAVRRHRSSVLLLGLCLCVLALRVTYTESPTAQVLTTPGSLGDTVYSLTLSGLLIFAFVFWLLRGIYTGRLAYHFTGIEVGLGVFVLAAVLSTCGASDKRIAITQTMTLLGPIVAALLLAQILDRPAKVRLVLAIVVGLAVVSAYQCAEQFFISNAITIEQYEKNPQMLLEPLGIETGTFQHFLFEHRLYSRGIRGYFTTSNSAASFAILGCAAAAILLLHRFRDYKAHAPAPRYAMFAGLAGVLTVAGLFLTQSKGGVLAFFAGAVACGLIVGIHRWLPAQRQRILTVLVPLALLLAAGAGYGMVRYGMEHGRLPGGNSMLVRWQYWAASAKMYAAHRWTGVGPGNFSDYYTHYKPGAALESVADPHNFLLSLIAQYGPLGLLGFLVMVFVPLWRSIKLPVGATPTLDAPPAWSFRRLALTTLLGISACLLFVRLLLIPMMANSPEVQLYELMTVHVAPVAAFVIGFLLIASPLDDRRIEPTDKHMSSAWQPQVQLGDGTRFHASSESTNPASLAILGCAVLAVLVHNLVDFALFEPGVWMALWILIACLVALRAGPQMTFDLAAVNSRLRRSLAGGGAFVLLGAYLVGVWSPAYRTVTGIEQAQRAVLTGAYDIAHRRLEAAVQADPLSPAAADFNARLYVQQYEQTRQKQPELLEEAARFFGQAIERNPADYKDYEKIGTVYSRQGKPQQAYEWYLKAASLYPGCERIWYELAQAAEQIGKTGLALCHYAKAIEIEDSYRQQFRQMYPDREKVVSRLGDKEYQYAKKRIEELSK